MKASVFTDEEQLITKAVDVLVKELGPVEASRFLALPRKKRVESVKRHRQWQAQLQQEEFFDRVFGAQSKGPVRK
ncbi:MAG: hypothetical protein A3G93_13855 [Nitrospinae bacterium RIFCSPLOWO2_12_FULL_45_22]|nr:MAG: hypothetical protein A3G93_13855 [Nitrospinae bacterium RIFCSPLOWO2_12_FULL_45_22]